MLAGILSSREQSAETIKQYQAILEIEPDNVDALNNLGVIYYRGKSYNEALKYLLKATRSDPQRDDIHNNLGLLYTEIGMYAEAKDEFEKAIRLGGKTLE